MKLSSEPEWEAFRGKYARVYFALLVFALMGTAWYYYFYKVPGKALDENFYRTFPLSERKITPEIIKNILTQEKGTEIQKMAVNAAFLRYRLDTENSGVFDRFMSSYQQGLWDVPSPDVWRSLFAEQVKAWKMARVSFLQSGTSAPQAVILPQNQSLHIGFKDADTPTIGTHIDVLVKLPEAFNPNAFAQYKWQMNGIDLPVPRIAYWKIDKYSTGTLGTLPLNLGLEPIWFIPDKSLSEIQIHCSDLPQWQVLDIRYN